ncbi:MAG: Universal stress protein 2 [Pseudomonadota bacterium]
MKNYEHILLAVDFFEHCEAVTNRARDLATTYQANFSIIHVVDSVPIIDAGYGADIPFNMDLTTELMAEAKKRLGKLAQKLDVTEDNLWLEIKENKVDLIVLGSHGRHGLALILGSTANGVLHHADCDVLAVRLRDD